LIDRGNNEETGQSVVQGTSGIPAPELEHCELYLKSEHYATDIPTDPQSHSVTRLKTLYTHGLV